MTASFEWKHGIAAVEKVQLAGSFTQCKPVEMEKTSDNEKWALKLDLPPGEYEFKFVVDGKWIYDELLPTTTNEMGTKNNLIVINAPSSSPSSSSSIEAINEEDDEEWEILEAPRSRVIEVERKFIVPDNYHERLMAQNFHLQKEFDEVLDDKYFDTHQHTLIKADHWLRQRNGDWELKYPVGDHSQCSTLYHETSCIEEIMTRLRPFLGPAAASEADQSLLHLLDSGHLKAFAHLETQRKCYGKDNVNIVIDATDWGHCVGEIEVMVTDQEEISAALQKIDAIGAELDFAHMDLNVLCNMTRQGT